MPDPNTFLLEIDRAEAVTAIRHALTAAGIPYETGVKGGASPWVAFFVPWDRLEQAKRVTAPFSDPTDDPSFDEVEDDRSIDPLAAVDAVQGFPWGPVQAVAALALGHMWLVFWSSGLLRFGRDLLPLGSIVQGTTLQEPWRLLTSIFLHVDLRHAAWNAVSMLVFAVPLIAYLGYRKTAAIYLAAGLGGGVTALAFAGTGASIVGSSGAVVGLFGAWIVLTLSRARHAVSGWRVRVRTLGIALLVLPSLISPTTSTGQSISVSSHMGGLLTGMLIGALISQRLLKR